MSLERTRRAPSLEHAVSLFNSSEAARTVTGLCRTLGAPQVSVGAAAGASGRVRITVAWDLTWYQWVVDAAAETTVAELGHGREIDELDVGARHWNARVAEGRVLLGMPRRRAANRAPRRR